VQGGSAQRDKDPGAPHRGLRRGIMMHFACVPGLSSLVISQEFPLQLAWLLFGLKQGLDAG